MGYVSTLVLICNSYYVNIFVSTLVLILFLYFSCVCNSYIEENVEI